MNGLGYFLAETPVGFFESDSGLILPSSLIPPEPAPPVGIELFAGCGGLSLGLEQGGIDVAVALEWDAAAAATYAYNLGMSGGRFVLADDDARAAWEKFSRRSGGCCGHRGGVEDPEFFGANRPRLSRTGDAAGELRGGAGELAGPGARAVVIGDIRGISGADLLEAGGLPPGSIHLVSGGPPCQGFSRAGRQDPADPRNNMVLEFLRIVGELRPVCFLMESVPPLVTEAKFRPLWDEFLRRATDLGYEVVADVLNAVNYGVPQMRRRAIAVGTLVGRRRFQFPLPTHWMMGASPDGRGWDMRPTSLQAGEEEDDAGADDAQGSLFE